jgi:hypothetical protein
MAVDPSEVIDAFSERDDDQGIVALAERLAGASKGDEAVAHVRAAIARLGDAEPKVQGGCIKLLYEIGYRKPGLISAYASNFLELLKSRNNRLVWGGMTALSTIASLEPGTLFDHREEILASVRTGSVITQDRGILTLSLVAAADPEYRKALLKPLLGFLRGCRGNDVAKFAESIWPAVDASFSRDYSRVLESRLDELATAARKRVEKLLRSLSA